VLAALAALFLAASLVTETAFRGQVPLGRVLAVAGLAFLVLAVLVPYRPPDPRRRDVSEQPQHPAVVHAVRLRLRDDAIRYEQGLRGKVAAGNDWLATHLAVVFGIAWTIWVFFIVPIVAYFLPAATQAHIFFFSSGWIQLFALPLMVYVSNKIQRSSDAQSEAQHMALTHIATISDQNKTLIEQNTELTAQVHALVVQQQPGAAPAERLATPAERSEGTGT
jgi:hypothetical protein